MHDYSNSRMLTIVYDEIQAKRRSQKAPKRMRRVIVEMGDGRKSDRAIVAI